MEKAAIGRLKFGLSVRVQHQATGQSRSAQGTLSTKTTKPKARKPHRALHSPAQSPGNIGHWPISVHCTSNWNSPFFLTLAIGLFQCSAQTQDPCLFRWALGHWPIRNLRFHNKTLAFSGGQTGNLPNFVLCTLNKTLASQSGQQATGQTGTPFSTTRPSPFGGHNQAIGQTTKTGTLSSTGHQPPKCIAQNQDPCFYSGHTKAIGQTRPLPFGGHSQNFTSYFGNKPNRNLVSHSGH